MIVHTYSLDGSLRLTNKSSAIVVSFSYLDSSITLQIYNIWLRLVIDNKLVSNNTLHLYHLADPSSGNVHNGKSWDLNYRLQTAAHKI